MTKRGRAMSAEPDLSVLRDRADRGDPSELRRLADGGSSAAADQLTELTSEEAE